MTEPAPRDAPLTYPGKQLGAAVLVLQGKAHPVSAPEALGAIRGRTPVVVAGSNGSMAQLRHKAASHGLALDFPVLPARTHGWAGALAPVLSRYGYIPSTFVKVAGASWRTVVLFLDDAQLDAMDATEGGYARIALPDDAVTVTGATDAGIGSGHGNPVFAYQFGAGEHLRLGLDVPTLPMSQSELFGLLASTRETAGHFTGNAGDIAARARVDESWRTTVTTDLKLLATAP